MSGRWAWCVVMAFTLFAHASLAQTVEEQLAESRAESLVGEVEDGGKDLESEQLGMQGRSIFRLNRMNRDQLMDELGLSAHEADSMLVYRSRFGAFIDPMELQAVPGWSLDLVRRLLPLVRLDTVVHLVPSMKERIDKGIQQLILRMGSTLEPVRGQTADSAGRRAYAGDAMRAMLQYRFRYRSSLDAGIRLEKDAGESWLARAHLPDHVSAFLSVRDLGLLSSLVVGDFEVGFAQGLAIWQGMAFRKGANTLELMRSGAAFKPHSGSDENRFVRGVSAVLHRGQWNLHVFSGMDRMDAHRVVDTISGAISFTGLQTSGLHRTVSELRDRKSLTDLVAGGRLAFASRFLWLGVNVVGHRFSGPFIPAWEPYALHALSGDRLGNASLDHHLRAGPLHIYGEWAVDRHGHMALTEGLQASPDPRLDIVVQARNFSCGYAGLHESPFAEGSRAQNEAGVYLGMEWRPARAFRVSAYVDRYRFRWLRYGIDEPSDGMDALVRLSWRPAKTTEWYGQASWESKPHDLPDMDPILPGSVGERRFRVRVHVSHAPDRFILLRIRMEYSAYQGTGKEHGSLGFVDLGWKNYTQLTRIMFRVLFFDTDGYGSRIYAYESALPGMYAIPPHAGTGLQWSIQGVRRLTKGWELGLGFRQNFMQNVDGQGSGYDRISGPRKTEWNLQIRSSF